MKKINFIVFMLLVLAFSSCKTKTTSGQKDINTDKEKGNATSTVGELYSGSSVNGNVYYYFLPSGKVLLSCPGGGLENFDGNNYCATYPNNCATYTKDGTMLNLKWNDNSTKTGKISANGDIEIDGTLIGLVQRVPNNLSASYEFTSNDHGISIAETTKFNSDGTFQVEHVGGIDINDGRHDGQNSAEFNSSHSGKYTISGFTITMTENNGNITNHTIYAIEKGSNPEFLGWDGIFLSRK